MIANSASMISTDANNITAYSNDNRDDRNTAQEETTKGATISKAGRKRGAESSNDVRASSDDDDDELVGWEEEIDIDELIDDAREYDDYNTQVEDEVAMYAESEMIAIAADEAAQRSASEMSEDVCVSTLRDRQKKCPGRKRRIVTVTQWDASARRQMIRQLGQRGVT